LGETIERRGLMMPRHPFPQQRARAAEQNVGHPLAKRADDCIRVAEKVDAFCCAQALTLDDGDAAPPQQVDHRALVADRSIVRTDLIDVEDLVIRTEGRHG